MIRRALIIVHKQSLRKTLENLISIGSIRCIADDCVETINLLYPKPPQDRPCPYDSIPIATCFAAITETQQLR